jgi:hypothetical protein
LLIVNADVNQTKLSSFDLHFHQWSTTLCSRWTWTFVISCTRKYFMHVSFSTSWRSGHTFVSFPPDNVYTSPFFLLHSSKKKNISFHYTYIMLNYLDREKKPINPNRDWQGVHGQDNPAELERRHFPPLFSQAGKVRRRRRRCRCCLRLRRRPPPPQFVSWDCGKRLDNIRNKLKHCEKCFHFINYYHKKWRITQKSGFFWCKSKLKEGFLTSIFNWNCVQWVIIITSNKVSNI